MRARELIFGAIAAALLITYIVAGSQLYPAVAPGAAPTPTPTAARTEEPAPRLPGTLAFVVQGDVYVMRGGTVKPLTSEGRNQQPELSEDGRTLLFARRESIDGQRVGEAGQIVNAALGYSSIVSKPSAGGAETKIIDGLRATDRRGFHQVSWFLSPALSPDGRRLAYVEDDASGGADLVVLDLASGRPRVYSRGAELADPAWSPDGRTLVTTRFSEGAPALLLWNTERPGTSQLVENLPDGEAYRPSFSPDGAWLIYTLRHGKGNDVHAAELASGRDVALTNDGHSWNGVFSPEGRWIAFLRDRSGTIDLYAMELGTMLSGGAAPREPQKLTKGQGVEGSGRPAWGQ
ncbi:hypothetical protein BH18CHL2_BH18CHL2_04390 [soil metagenome]